MRGDVASRAGARRLAPDPVIPDLTPIPSPLICQFAVDNRWGGDATGG